MGYGHADNLAGGGTEPDRAQQSNGPENSRQPQTPPGEPLPAEPLPVPPDWFARTELESALWSHDVGALYRWLSKAGMSQRQIAIRAEQSQSEVSDLLAGRRGPVRTYEVLLRVCHRFGIPPERMGMSWWGSDGRYYGPPRTYPGEVTAAHTPRGVPSAMLRRHLIALGGVIMAGVMAGVPVDELELDNVGELLDDLGTPPPVLLPSRLTPAHVAQVQDLTQRLDDAWRAFGADPQTSTDAAMRAEQLLTVPGPKSVKQAMLSAVAQRHVHAGIAAFDGDRYTRSLYHLAKAVDLARQAKDPYLQALALNWAGLANIEHGHPDDGLKMLQAAQVAAWNIPPDDPRRTEVEACALLDSATALAMLGQHHEASRRVGTARDLWTPTRTTPRGDMDWVPALLELDRGRLDVAEQFATASVRRWEGISQRARTSSGIILATIHVKAGERNGLHLARDAITDAAALNSARTHKRLLPLADALDTRPGTDARELARRARQVAA